MFELTGLKGKESNESVDINRRRFLIRSLFAIGATQIMLLPLEVKAAFNFINERRSSSLLYRGFNSEIKDTTSNLYHLGNGYRSYNPSVCRFYSVDDYSPFGAGGINPYTYCNGDPINFLDYDGHLSTEAGIIIAVSLSVLFVSLFSFGFGVLSFASGVVGIASFLAGASIVSGVFGVTSGAVGIAQGALMETDPELASNLMIASTVFGIGSILVSFGSVGFGSAAQLMGKSSLAWKNTVQLTHLTETSLLAHGAPALTITSSGMKSASALAKIVQVERSGIMGVNEVFHLRSCYGAFGGRMFSQGQVLANKLNSPVRAYSGRIIPNPNKVGSMLFRPQQNVHLARVSTGGNLIMSGIFKTAVHMKYPTMLGF